MNLKEFIKILQEIAFLLESEGTPPENIEVLTDYDGICGQAPNPLIFHGKTPDEDILVL
jgi:hypothetical protein